MTVPSPPLSSQQQGPNSNAAVVVEEQANGRSNSSINCNGNSNSNGGAVVFTDNTPGKGGSLPEQQQLHSSSVRSRSSEAAKQLFCGGLAGSVAKTVTAPLSRLTILFQVHSLVTTKENRPNFAMSMGSGMRKIVERGGTLAMWRGNMTSVLHRFPYSAINFYVYENTLDVLSHHSYNQRSNDNSNTNHAADRSRNSGDIAGHEDVTASQQSPRRRHRLEETHETGNQLVRRMTKLVLSASSSGSDDDEDDMPPHQNGNRHNSNNNGNTKRYEDSPAWHKFTAGAVAGVSAVTACYPLDLVRTRLTTELEGRENYRGITDAFAKIYKLEGVGGFYSGIWPTLLVAVPNFAISYTTYGTLKEYMIDDDLFYNLRRIDADSGEAKLGFALTVACGAASGILATLVTFPMDTIRRRMQVQNLHVAKENRMTSHQQLQHLIYKEGGLKSLYRGLTPEILKVIPMVGTMFFVYEQAKEILNVTHGRR